MSSHSLVAALPLPAAVLDSDAAILAVNPAFTQWLGGTGHDSISPADGWTRAVAAAGRGTVSTADYAAGGGPARVRFAPLGDRRVLVTLDPPPPPPTVVDSFTRFAQFVPFAAWLRDDGGRYVHVNPEYLRATRRLPDDWLGRHVGECWPAGTAERFVASDRQVISGRRVVDVVDTVDGPDGEPAVWHNVKFPLQAEDGRWYAAGIGIDVTARRRADDTRRAVERQLLQAQRLESLGVMAGGVAHDFNNLLTTILGNAGLARLHLPTADGAAADCLRKVEAAAGSAAALCQQMLAYSGRGQFVVGRLHLDQLVKEMEPVLRSLVPAGSYLSVRADQPTPPVRGDAAQMRQVILNLVSNAADAVADSGGRVTVSTSLLHAGRQVLDARPETRHLLVGVYALLEVADTGGGMDEATRSRIFDPFFTTKFTGRGLGLSAVQGIVRGHKGAVQVDTRPGGGSTFRVLLPGVGSITDPADGRRRGLGRTLLVIDDEDEVRATARKLLEAVGFTVLTAVDGADGVDTFRSFHEQVAAVLLDLTLPQPSARTTLRLLRAVRADVPVILLTAEGPADPLTTGGDDPPAEVLPKPFTADELQAAVFAALGG